ncbi:restriction endonuclease subunit S [Pseudoalteromonas carrageenovora]|uniref:restriction endonuclease subunit S n=1 Tax=Pseudoalteromonas carrageenovora TaxID=227 RepID=UPI0026E42C68|nr:restriction endonuclease subunit S [Pseudoalteromonas carrageenovora]MDO6465525.1 restriction endonuclease subunit S [Pseudoalteromonas carrageenovora]
MKSDINLRHLTQLPELPKNWAHSSVDELCIIEPVGNKKLAQKQYVQKGKYPVIDQGIDFIGGYTDKNELVIEVPEDGAFIIFGDHSRAFKLVDFNFVPGADGVKVLRPVCVLPKWAYYFFKAIYLPNKGYARHFQYLKEAYLPLPPLSTQKLIVDKIEELFSHIDAGVEGLKQAKAKLQQYRQSVLKDAVTGKLTESWREQNADKLEPANELLERILEERRANWEAEQLKAFEEKGKVPKDDKWKDKYKAPLPPETEDVPDIPIEWGYLRLEAISNIQGGITVDAKRKPDETTLLPYLRVANVQRGYLDLSKMRDIRVPNDKVDSLLLQDGDILFNEGGDRDKLGRGWVWRNEIDKCIYQNHVFRARLYSNELVPEFVSIFGNIIGKEYFIKQGKQTTNLASINKTKLSAFPVPFCSLNEMTKIIEFVTDKVGKTDRTIIEVDKKILHASQLKSSILAKAFSGELIENIETDETAEQLLEKIQTEKQLLEEKAKLAKKKPNTRAKKMDKQPIIDVLKKAKKALSVDELFEQAGFQNDVSPEGIEAFYQELKVVTENANVTVTPVMLKEKKQGDKFEYKEVKENEAG